MLLRVLRCRVLGPLEVVAETHPVDVGGLLPRRLVAALVAARRQPLSEDRLIDALWGDKPPANPSASLASYVSRVRKATGRHGLDVLRRGPGGWTLDTDSDVVRFEDTITRGREAQQTGRYADALTAFGQALALWRGTPYPELDRYAEAERAVLTEAHAIAVEERAAVLLALGDAPTAVAELHPAVRAEPYRERRWELLIMGLYRCARQAEALSALREVRGLLAEDLGIDPGPDLQNLERRLLAQDPALLIASAQSRPSAPPRPLSRFVGRVGERDLLTAALAEYRLVTLVGPGGAGKTRLAVEWAGDAFFARLADVRVPEDLPSAIATAIGLADVPQRFTGVDGLLVLDNCEHLIEAVADLAVTLLAGNPGLRILATSRQELKIDGERLLTVDPLPRADAITLLVDRIAAVRPGWQPTDEDTRHLDRLAAALDGIPLALELAAARARVLGLRELADDRFPARGRSPRGGLSPHGTLEATVAWSVNLLPPRDRRMILRLWPFEGGFALEGAVALGSDLAALSSLVTRSVVAADITVTPARYRLLEIIRAYCRDQDPDPEGSRAAHAAWVRDLVARTVPALRGRRSARAIQMLHRELPNLRAGLAHDLVADPVAALRTAGSLEWFWIRTGYTAEGLRLLTAALERAPDAPAVDRARALSGCAALHWIGGDIAEVKRRLDQAVEVLAGDTGEPARRLLGQLRYYEALLLSTYGDFDRAVVTARESIALAADAGDEWLGVLPHVTLGTALVGRGEIAEGRQILADAIEQARRVGYGWGHGLAAQLLARSWLAEDPVRALPLFHEAVEQFRNEGDLTDTLAALAQGALVLFHLKRPLAAATLLAAAFRHAARRGIQLGNGDPPGFRMIQAKLAELDESVLAQARAAGADLTLDDMVALLPAR